MKLINRLSNRNIKNQYDFFKQGATVRNKDIHIVNTGSSIIVYERQITPLLRQFKRHCLKIIH